MSNDFNGLGPHRPASLTHYPASGARRRSRRWYYSQTGRNIWPPKPGTSSPGTGTDGANSDHIQWAEGGADPRPPIAGAPRAHDPMVRRAFEWVCPWDYRSFKGKWKTIAEVFDWKVATIRRWRFLSTTTGKCRMRSADIGRLVEYIENRVGEGMELVKELKEQQKRTKLAEDRAFSNMKVGAERHRAQQGLGIGAYARVGADYLSGLIGGSNGKGGKG